MRHPDRMQKVFLATFIATFVLVIITGAVWGYRLLVTSHEQKAVQVADLAIGGFPLKGRVAPDFHLTDQFGQPVALSSMRGHEIVLAFIDARCVTLCPLTSEILYNAKAQLGLASSKQVMLIAVNANPDATSITEVQAWSIKHGMLHQWSFLTGTARQLQAVYKNYEVYDQMNTDGSALHDPATFIIDATGHEQLYFETLDSNSQSDLRNEVVGLEAGMRQWLPQQQ